MSEAILEVENLTKRYGARVAVNALSFAVQPGDIYGFLGRNGAGKSTTIRMILGLVWPTSGAIRVDGYPVSTGRHPHPWPVGAMVESPIFYDHLPGRTNLEMLASLSGGASKARIDEIVELVGLENRQREKVSVYSHGMRQRLGLAQALLPQPKIVILDEPLDGLDPNGIRELRDVMLRVVSDKRVTIFMSSHILSEVELTCNRVVVIHEGNRVFEGTTAELVSDARRVRLRTAGARSPAETLAAMPFIDKADQADGSWILAMDPAMAPELARRLVAAEFDVLELTPLRERLEDVFIGLTGASGGGESGAGAVVKARGGEKL